MAGELQDTAKVPGKALQAVVAAVHHDLLTSRIAAHGLPVVQDLVGGFHKEKIAARSNVRQDQALPLL
jgi:hypothetical protein